MLKLKLSRSSSDLIGPNCLSSEDNESTELEALRIELDEKQYQLEKLRKQMLEEIQAVREEEHQRLVFALSGLRRRLHQEKLAELEEQKKNFSRYLQKSLKQDVQEVPREHAVDMDGIPFIDEDEDEMEEQTNTADNNSQKQQAQKDDRKCKNDVVPSVLPFENPLITNNLENNNENNGLSSLNDRDSRAVEIRNGQEFSKEIEKRLQNMKKPDPHHSSFNLKHKTPPNLWCHRDKFRSCLPYDLHSSISVMTPIREDKDEYDWFEERKQLLEENSTLMEKLSIYEKEKNKLEIELQETKDHNELLEFRILELEEFTAGSTSQRNPKLEHKEVNTDPWWEIDFTRNLPVLLKLAQMKNLTETREDGIQNPWGKLAVVEGRFSSLPNVSALLQVAFMLELLTPISQEFASIKDDNAKTEPENKEWLRDMLEVISKTGFGKTVKTDEEPLSLHFEGKPFLCKTSSLDKSMHSSMDSASEISDMSQGGETGYSSDESIDNEDIYQLNKNVYNSQISYSSDEGNSLIENSVMNNILQKFADVCSDIGRSSDGGNVIKTRPDDNYLNYAKSKVFWNPIDMMNRIQELEIKENKAKEIMQEFQEKMDHLQKENDALHNKWCKVKESENNMKMNEEALKNELAGTISTQNNLQQSIFELIEKDNLSKCRIDSLEKERDKLRMEATQLLQLLDNCKQVTQNLESSHSALHLHNAAQKDCNLTLDIAEKCYFSSNNENNLRDTSKKVSLISPRTNCNDLNDILTDISQQNPSVKAEDSKTGPLLFPSSCMQCKDSSLPCALKLGSLNEIESLQKLLNDKNKEIKNKETEYTLKIEALKCDLEETVANFEEKLDTAQRNLYQLQERLEALSQSKDALESNFKKTCTDLQIEKSSYLEQIQTLQDKNADLQKKLKLFQQQIKQFSPVSEDVYESAERNTSITSLSDHKEASGVPKKKLRELENHLSVLCREAEEFSKEKDSERNLNKEFLSGTEDDNLLEKIQEMLKLESCLKQRVFELENKETAYKETLREADKIIANVEKSYQERVEELEATEGKLRAKIVQLEQNEKRLRQTLKNANRNSEVGKFGELLDRLLESEASEQRLRERIFEQDQREKEYKQTVRHLQKEKEVMENELQEQEAIIQTVQSLKRTEKDLRKQIEALETSECALQETLSQADNILAERENKLQNQIQILEAELENIQQSNAGLRISEKELKLELEENCKRICELQEKLSQCQKVHSMTIPEDEHSANDLQENRVKMESDPVRLRQMSDLMETNGKLELQILELQSIIDKLHQRNLSLESEITHLSSAEHSKEMREKQDQDRYLHLNLELISKESKIESLQDKIKVLEVGNVLGEIQSLSFHGEELKELKDKINSISSFIQDCNCCNCVNCRPLLHDIQSQVHLLDEIISGTCPADSNSAKKLMFKAGSKIDETKANAFSHRSDIAGKPVIYKDKQSSDELTRNTIPESSILKDISKTDDFPNYQKQISYLENVLKEKKMQLETKEEEVGNYLEKIKTQESLLNKKTMELENVQNNLNSLQKKAEELQEKQNKSELLEQQLRETLLRQKQDLKLSAKQIQQLEQQISSLNQHLKRVEQTVQENNNYKDRIQELEGQLQKMKDCERKLHADNVHLHHKVEAQRERINSLQLIKKEYKQITSKCDMFEKQKKIADQTIAPLKNKILHLTEKCKEKDQLILLLTKQQNHTRKINSAKTYIKQEDNNNNECAVLDELSDNSSCQQQEENSRFSSASSDPSDSSMDSSSDNCLKSVSPRSRIPRYTALTSPLMSPRSRQDSLNQNGSNIEMSPVQKIKTTYSRSSGSPKVKHTTPKKCPNKVLPESTKANIPSPPSNFQVTRQVGHDSLLVAWTPPPVGSNVNNDNAGYQIFVNGILHQKVRSPGRTKALLNSLQLAQPLQIAIRTVSTSGSLSSPSSTTFVIQANQAEMNSDKKLNCSPLDNPVFNQNLIKQKFNVIHNHAPQNFNSATHSYELNLKIGDEVAVFGPVQPNGFYFGEANGRRGLIPAHVLQRKSSEMSTKNQPLIKQYAFVD